MANILRTLLLMAILFVAKSATASVVLPMSLDQLNDQAGHVIHGICISNSTGLDSESGMLATWTTFSVTESIKGTQNSTYTIKQIGGTDSDLNLGFKAFGIPKFTVGEEYILFLYGKSDVGFSSPVALQQGNFKVNKSSDTVSNGRDVSSLLENLPARIVLPKGLSDAMAASGNNRSKTQGKSKNTRQNNRKMDKTEFIDVIRKLNRK